MANNFTTNFRYDIGETVTLVNCPDHRLHVIARLAEECPGGVQYYYNCRVSTCKIVAWRGKGEFEASAREPLWKFNEIELLPVPAEVAEEE